MIRQLHFTSNFIVRSTLILIILTGCHSSPSSNSLVLPTPIPVALPSFLAEVWPPPNAVVSKHDYLESLHRDTPLSVSKGISIALLKDKVDDYRYSSNQTLTSRITMSVDGTTETMDPFVYNGLLQSTFKDENGKKHTVVSGPYYMSWSPILDAGQHQVKLQVVKNTGEVLEFAWSFEISDSAR